MSIPGVGKFTGLAIASEIDDIIDSQIRTSWLHTSDWPRCLMHHEAYGQQDSAMGSALAHMMHAQGTTVLTEF